MNRTEKTAKTAVIAALYATLTYVSAIFGIAYGPIQFRISEALCILPLFSPQAAIGLTIGCFISNIMSFNPLDMLFGTFATAVAAALTYLFRKVKLFSLPLLSMLMPVIINSLVIGVEISFFYLDGFTFYGFAISALQVGIGEFVVIFGLGIPLYKGFYNKKIKFPL